MNNFIKTYELYASGNEASASYHTWGAFATLSACIGRRIWFDQTYYKVYPNLYIIYVGEPGDGKSISMAIAKGFAQKMQVPIAPPSITREALTQLMSKSNEKSECLQQTTIDNVVHEYSHISVFANEITTLLAAGGNPIGFIEFFTDIYADQEVFKVVTKNKGTDFIVGPYVTMLACMTPEQTSSMLKQNIISGGFSRRVIFVYGKRKPKGVPFPKLTEEQKEAKQFLIDHLLKIKEWKGEFQMTPEAKEFFTDWYHKKHFDLNKPNPAVIKNWFRSKDVLLLKLSMLIAVSEFSYIRLIELRHLEQGLAMLNTIEPDIGRVFAGAGRNVGAEIAHKVLRSVEEAPGKKMSAKKILALMYNEGNAKEISEALDFLCTTGKLRRSILQGPTQVEMLEVIENPT